VEMIPEDQISPAEAEVTLNGKPVYKIDTRPSQALVVHCGDPRFQAAFRMFITKELGIPNYTPLIIGGGVHAFGAQSLLPKNFKILWQQIKFFVKEGRVNQVIFINHEDCKWYEKMQGLQSRIKLPVIGRQDLQTAARTILRDFTGVRVRSFWAAVDGDDITFNEVSPD
jgi:hypothetical protein